MFVLFFVLGPVCLFLPLEHRSGKAYVSQRHESYYFGGLAALKCTLPLSPTQEVKPLPNSSAGLFSAYVHGKSIPRK